MDAIQSAMAGPAREMPLAAGSGARLVAWSGTGDPVPVTRGGIVSRPELFERLGRAARVTEVSAPAGSGKTVLLQSWIAEAGLAERAAWVSVQGGERDPQRFWIAVADALRGTDAASALVRPLTAAPDLDGWAVVERLLKGLARLEDQVWLVIEMCTSWPPPRRWPS